MSHLAILESLITSLHENIEGIYHM